MVFGGWFSGICWLGFGMGLFLGFGRGCDFGLFGGFVLVGLVCYSF